MANKIPSDTQWQDLATKVKSKQDALGAGDITTNLIANNAVTAGKIDFSTFGNQSTYVEIGNILIAWGSSALSCPNNQDTRSEPISFGVTFASAPKVFVQPTVWAPVRTNCAIGITTVSFRALLSQVFGSTLTVDFQWMAIGVKASS